MKVWTYAEMSTKVLTDLDLLDKAMVSDNELIGYFNEAVLEGESEIITLNQDYFLTMGFLPAVQGTVRYNLPGTMFANRIRGIMYNNGSLIYEIRQYRRKDKFIKVAYTDFNGQGDDYQYLLMSNLPGQAQIEIHPASRETAVLTPGSQFTPFQVFFLRRCQRIPILGEYANTEVFATTQVNVGGNTIQTQVGTTVYGISAQGVPGCTPGSIAYVTGDVVRFTPAPNATLPSPLVQGVAYYVIQGGNGVIKVASTLANALAGTAITLTSVGTVYFTMQVQATFAIQQATLIDIPQFSTFVMQWVKCRIYEKEVDPRLTGAIATLAQQKQQMIDTLVKSIDDDDDTIQMDFSFYNEMS